MFLREKNSAKIVPSRYSYEVHSSKCQKFQLPASLLFRFTIFIFQWIKFVRNQLRFLSFFQPGTYITVLVKNVTKDQYQSLICQPTVLYGLLPYEQKMSVLNLVLRRSILDEEQLPIKSKEPMVFQCGYRRFKACPVLSQHTNGAKHKVSNISESWFHNTVSFVDDLTHQCRPGTCASSAEPCIFIAVF